MVYDIVVSVEQRSTALAILAGFNQVGIGPEIGNKVRFYCVPEEALAELRKRHVSYDAGGASGCPQTSVHGGPLPI